MAQFTIVGEKFTPAAFADYAAHVPLRDWRPSLIVLHNTAVPTLKERPNGLSKANIDDLHHYYADVQGWSGGPHLFVDASGIWVFNPLDRRGVHSPSWNARSWGVEMLGDYATEGFDAGEGEKVQANAIGALAGLFRRLGLTAIDDANFKLHKEDPKTTHVCPGKNVHKAAVREKVQTLLTSASVGVEPEVATKVVVYRRKGGQAPSAILDASLRGGTVYADAAALAKATGIATAGGGEAPVRAFVGERFSIVWKPETNRVYLLER